MMVCDERVTEQLASLGSQADDIHQWAIRLNAESLDQERRHETRSRLLAELVRNLQTSVDEAIALTNAPAPATRDCMD